jgi:sugar phosphate isomerase/epimerase
MPRMDRRAFVGGLGAALLAPALGSSVAGCASASAMGGGGAGTRRVKRVGIQLYSLRDAARADLERTLADIAAAGYKDVEMLASNRNFGMPPAQIRAVLDKNGLRAPSTHTAGTLAEDLDRHLDEAATLGHTQLIVAGLPKRPTLDAYRAWADRLNEAGAKARQRGIWLGHHNHADDMKPVEGQVPYDLLAERADPSVTRLQLDTGNMAMSGRDPLDYMKRFGPKYWSFHVKDVAQLGATHDTELGKGVLDFRKLLGMIDRIDEKHLFVEQETYPGTTPLESVRRDYAYLSALEF